MSYKTVYVYFNSNNIYIGDEKKQKKNIVSRTSQLPNYKNVIGNNGFFILYKGTNQE